MSLLTVFGINVDLYMAIVKPYLCNNNVKVRTIVVVIIICWAIIFLSATVFMYAVSLWKEFSFVMSILGITLIIFLFYFHMKINKELSGMVTRERTGSINSSTKSIIRTYKRSARLASAIWATIIIVYFPSIVMVVYRLITFPSAFVNTYVFTWLRPFTLTNVLWNPILYYYRMKSVRQRFARMLRRGSYNIEQKSKSIRGDTELAFIHRNTSKQDVT